MTEDTEKLNTKCPVNDLARLLNLSTRRVQSLVQEGVLPKPQRPGVYDVLACNHAYLAHLKNLAASKTKIDDEIKLIKKERDRLKLDHEKGLVMKKADVASLCKYLLNVIKTEVLAQPLSLPSILVGKSEAEISDILERENRKLLEMAASGFQDIKNDVAAGKEKI